jgi:hypothetical protein
MVKQTASGIVGSWHRTRGLVPYFLVGAGVAMTVAGVTFFWPGVAVAYVGLGWLLVQLWVERIDLESSEWIRHVAIFVVGFGFVSWLAFRPAPMMITAEPLENNYLPDAEIAGIKWNPAYYELRIHLINASKELYSNLNILLRTDLFIHNIGFMTYSNECFAGVEALVKDMTFTITGVNRPDLTIPLQDKDSYGSIFHIHCGKVFANEGLEFVAAIVSQTMKAGQHSGGLFDPRTKPSWLTMKIQYDGFGRTNYRDFLECFVGDCANIAMPLKHGG